MKRSSWTSQCMLLVWRCDYNLAEMVMGFESCAYEPDPGLAVDKAANRLKANIIAGQRWPVGVSQNRNALRRRKGADAKQHKPKTPRWPRDSWIPRMDEEVATANELHHALRRCSAEPAGTGAYADVRFAGRDAFPPPHFFSAARCAAQLSTPAYSYIPPWWCVAHAIVQARPQSWACLARCSA